MSTKLAWARKLMVLGVAERTKILMSGGKVVRVEAMEAAADKALVRMKRRRRKR